MSNWLELSNSCDLLIIVIVSNSCDTDSMQSYYHDISKHTAQQQHDTVAVKEAVSIQLTMHYKDCMQL